MRAKNLTLQERKDIFLALVSSQDQGAGVSRSRDQITKQYKITDAQLREIEEEGIEKEWPPLDSVDAE